MSIPHWAKGKRLKRLVPLELTTQTTVQSTTFLVGKHLLEVMLIQQDNRIQQNVRLDTISRNLDNRGAYLLKQDIMHLVKDA